MSGYPEQPPAYSATQPIGWKGPEQQGYGSEQHGGYSGQPHQAGYAPQSGYAPQAYPVQGGNSSYDGAENGEGATFLFSDKRVRQGFIRKVFLILTAQLLVTTAICAIFFFVNDVKRFVRANSWTYYIGYAVFFVTYIVLVCCRSVARKTPNNYIALTILTLAMSYMVSVITSFYDTESVMIAFGITVGLCLCLTLFAWQTRIDFTMCSGLLFCLVIVLFLTGMACWIWGLIAGWSKVINVVYGGVGALVFSVFLMYDVQMVVGGRKYELSPEEYVFGAVQIYLDVVYIFLMLLSVVGGSRSSS